MTISNIKISLCQLNTIIGAIDDNTEKAVAYIKEQKKAGANIIVFPELFICGYPPNDLLLSEHYKKILSNAFNRIIAISQDVCIIMGHPFFEGNNTYNAAYVISDGNILHQHIKTALPNYSVFDEKRYFKPGNEFSTITIYGIKCAILICEDIWDPTTKVKLKELSPEFVFCLNASNYERGKITKRQNIIKNASTYCNSYFFYLNTVGAQDSLVYDGASFVTNPSGKIIRNAKQFNEDCINIEYNSLTKEITPNELLPQLDELSEIYAALVLGVRDYIKKNNINGILIGLSGGIDSALSLAICVAAIGSNRIHCALLPSKYTSDLSIALALEQAKLLGVNITTHNIEPLVEASLSASDTPRDSIAAQNIQARARALILMALSNKNGFLLVNTSNRSELATGYGTLYGDLCGGFSALKNIPKTMVFKLAKHINNTNPTIVPAIIDREPTAELADNQLDSNELPPYTILDAILELYIDKRLSLEQIVAYGYEADLIEKVIKLVNCCEFKRQQSAPGVQISPTSFGLARRMPITAKIPY